MPTSHTAHEEPWLRQHYHVPREDETLFATPSLGTAEQLARDNHELFASHDPDLQGRSLVKLRRQSRAYVLSAARRYTAELLENDLPEQPSDFIIACGHQPSLFHPGVWVKNFALDGLSRRLGGVGLNIVVDNDTLSTSSIRVPAGNRQSARYQAVPFEGQHPTRVWEEARVLDPSLFRSFGSRLVRHMANWDIEPVVAELWPHAEKCLKRTDLLRDCLTAARSRLEHRWGAANLELPISHLCTGEPFLWFACHLLANLPRFRDVHNSVLQQYRSAHRIRSRNHPVPELKEIDGWLEAPFWTWREGEQRRGRVLAKEAGREIHLSDGNEVFAQLPLGGNRDACCAVDVLRELAADGVRFRTRALTTTLFSRLCLADLFVHGIGGAKYDQMTDRIIAQFYELPVPPILTLSATLLLPMCELNHVAASEEQRLLTLLRDLDFNSDRHLTTGHSTQADRLIQDKQALISEQEAASTQHLTRRERRLHFADNYFRYQRFQEVDRKLARLTQEKRLQVENELNGVRMHLEANRVLTDRDYSFCLYAAEKIRPFMTRLSERLAHEETA
jgi:hypothetical protein